MYNPLICDSYEVGCTAEQYIAMSKVNAEKAKARHKVYEQRAKEFEAAARGE